MSVQLLPPELFNEILEHIAGGYERQQTTLQLTRALSTAPIPLHHLFEVISLRTPSSVVQLHRRIRQDAAADVENGCHRMVRVLRVESFTADAEVVINLLALLDDLVELRLCIGPMFVPEHLKRVLGTPRKKLRHLELCFRPYVAKVNYLPFLKGSYYDLSLLELARWPKGLQFLSIVQQPFPSVDDETLVTTKGRFAQPIAFFSFQPITQLLSSMAMSSISSLTIRIPGRDVLPYVSCSSTRLTHLDFSTCQVTLRPLEKLLMRQFGLTHLVLDDTGVIPKGEPSATEAAWVSLGKTCAAFGITLAKDQEKVINDQLLANQSTAAATQNEAMPGSQQKARKGRKGVALSNISIRDATKPEERFSSLALSEDSETISVAAGTSKVRISPLRPALSSICVTSPINGSGVFSRIDISRFFCEGWENGIKQLRVRWTRLKISIQASHLGHSKTAVLSCSENGMLSTASIQALEDLAHREYPPPSLCFEGPISSGREDGITAAHELRCGHYQGGRSFTISA